MASRLAGLARQKTIAHVLGQSTPAADALAAAFRIPNVVQNLLGEGAMSASFVPEYARLIKEGRDADAERLKNSLLGVLALAVTAVASVGVLGAPVLVDLLAPGFAGARRELAISATRILFPSVALLALSAWCIGVLNTHRRFFLSYAAPVVWNLAIITAVLLGGVQAGGQAVVWAAWGALGGSVLQLAVQLPTVVAVAGRLAPTVDLTSPATRTVLSRFGPAVLSRGVVQIGAFIDTWLASWLPIGAVATLANAQLLYTLPLSLFVVSVTATALPRLAVQLAGPKPPDRRAVLDDDLRQITFFMVPSAVGLAVLGGSIGMLVFQSGAFTAADAHWLRLTVAAAALGLVPQASTRLYATAHFALGDTAGPLRAAAARLVLSTVLGATLALAGPGWAGLDPRFGTVGLVLGWVGGGMLEWLWLRRSLAARGITAAIGAGYAGRVWGSAAAAAALGLGAGQALAGGPLWLRSVASLGVFGLGYLAAARVAGLPQLARIWSRR